MNTSSSRDEKWKYMSNPREGSASKKVFLKSSSKPALKERSPLNIKIDLSSSINADDKLRSTSTFKKARTAPKDENIKVFIRLKPKSQREQS
jgi:hypothetical protein